MRLPQIRRLLHLPLPALLLFACAAAHAADPYVARHALDFEYRGEPPLRMPTGVAVRADGVVFVADGVNDRVLHFDPQGQLVGEIRQIGEETLSRPLNVKVDAADRLWIADTGHQRIVVRAPDGTLAHVLRLEQGSAGRAPDLTDVAPLSDGQGAWVVDNDNHRLVRVDLQGAVQAAVGENGESLGQFHYPFMIALGRGGDLFVTDVVNARVQVLSAAGRPVGSLGTYGADLGQLYRPQGVVGDRDGDVWVSDSTMGVVQVFTPAGGVRDVLREASGQPLKLEMPCGLAFDADGNLYVAEVQAHRVRKFAITVNRQVPATSKAPAATRTITSNQPRACTVCHIEWLETFAQGRGTVLMDVPVSTPEQPVVSRETTCLSCHDGSVADSRRRVWQEHGHRTGMQPPAGMNVPPNLPLVNGRVACRTCHSAHTSGGPTGDIAQAVFLRVPNTASELCISCHGDKTRGPELGTHPTGGMPWPVPRPLIDAGARVGPNPRELTCQVCHTPHGAAHEHLLVLATESNQLCLTCHAQMRPGMFREGAAEHPLSPKVNAMQAQSVREMGTTLGPDEHLICLSCHRLHHGKGKRYMLADELGNAQLCLRCHADRQVLLGSAHDLRSNFPEEKNRLGMTPETGGPCSACHLFHRYARAPEASDLDPGGGKCITCHQPDRVAQAKVLGPLNHPRTRCADCHNPHETRFGHFLAAQPSDRCRTCHADNARVMNGPHDLAREGRSTGQRPAATWPAASLATHDTCLACHRPHGTVETGFFRAGLAPGALPAEAACTACHPDVVGQADSRRTMLHPRDLTDRYAQDKLPVVTLGDGKQQLACRTCHDPHRGGERAARLLRVDDPANTLQLCQTCHTDRAHISAIGHGPEPLHAAGFETTACSPCHTIHAAPSAVESRYLWPRKLGSTTATSQEQTLPPTTPDHPAALADHYCLECHRTGGPVIPPAIATHPRVDMFNPDPPETASYLPLFDDQGGVDPKGHHSCRTCHLTHGRSTPAPVPETLGTLAGRELRARMWHLRTFVPTNVCSICHGFDALRRFMYFHDAARRSGPVTLGGPAAAPARAP